MQRPSWSSLKERWGNLFFFDSLSLFLSKLYEDKGKALRGVILFDPKGRPLPPKAPPLYMCVIYQKEMDFLKENIKIRSLDNSGIIEPLCYGSNTFKEMLKRPNTIAPSVLKGIVLYEINSGLEEIDNPQ